MAENNPTGLGATEAPSTVVEDRRDQEAVLAHVLELHPAARTLAELVCELSGGSAAFRERDRIERAVRDLASAGLLHRCCGLVLPTRAAVHFDAIQS